MTIGLSTYAFFWQWHDTASRPLTLEHLSGVQDTCAQAGITGARRHPRTQDHPI